VSGEQRYTAIPKGFAAPTDTRWHSIRDRRIWLMHKSWMVGPSPTMTLGIAQIRDRRIGLTRKSWMVGPRPTMTLGSLRSATAGSGLTLQSWMVGPALARLTMALGE
jgi:hypothetical protein